MKCGECGTQDSTTNLREWKCKKCFPPKRIYDGLMECVKCHKVTVLDRCMKCSSSTVKIENLTKEQEEFLWAASFNRYPHKHNSANSRSCNSCGAECGTQYCAQCVSRRAEEVRGERKQKKERGVDVVGPM